MLCFGGGTIDVAEPVPLELQQLQEQEPPWLSAFLDSEDYLTDCPLNCFNKNHGQEQEESAKPARPHRRRYFCIECPEEGAFCLARVMDQHFRHRVLKIRKATGIGSPVILVRDIDPLFNIDYVHRLSNTADESLYVKLRSFRQSIWGRSPQQILCYECLRLASSASKDDQKYKYCSIKCAYPSPSPTKMRAVPKLLSPQDQLGGCMSSVTSVANDNLQPPRGLMRTMSCTTTSLRRDREFSRPRGAAAPEAPVPASPTTSESSSSVSKGWRSRLSRILSFSSSKKHIPHMENLSPSTVSSQERRSSSVERFEISPWKESEGDGKERISMEPRVVDQGQVSGHPPRQTLLERRQSLGNERVNHTPKRSAKVGSKDGSLESDESLLVRSTSNVGPSVRRLNDPNVRAGTGTRICWRTRESNVSDDEGVQDHWGAMRGRVLSSESMPYVRMKLDNELSPRRSSLEPLQVPSTVPAAPYSMKGFRDVPGIRYSRARVESAVYPGATEDTPAPAFGSAIDNSNRPISREYPGNYLTLRNALFETREEWGSEYPKSGQRSSISGQHLTANLSRRRRSSSFNNPFAGGEDLGEEEVLPA